MKVVFRKKIDRLENTTLKAINREFKSVLDDVLARVDTLNLFKKDLDDHFDEIDDLVDLYSRKLNNSPVQNIFDDSIAEGYSIAAQSTVEEIDVEFSFDERDSGFFRFMGRAGKRLFNSFFASSATKLHSILTTSLSAGDNWQKVKRSIRDTMNYTDRRAETIVRTEIARGVIASRINQYKKADHVMFVEWSAAPESRCSGVPSTGKTCQEMDGVRYSKTKASGLIPAHPNCRCDWIPVTRTQLKREAKEQEAVKKEALNTRYFMGNITSDKSIPLEHKKEVAQAMANLPAGIRKHIAHDLENDKLVILHATMQQVQKSAHKNDIGGYYVSADMGGTQHEWAQNLLKQMGIEEPRNKRAIVIGNSLIPGKRQNAAIHETAHYLDDRYKQRTGELFSRKRKWRLRFNEAKTERFKRWVRDYGYENSAEFLAVQSEKLLSKEKNLAEELLNKRTWRLIKDFDKEQELTGKTGSLEKQLKEFYSWFEETEVF